jgi:uncharacterized protein YndB with AHSA1/START domain
MSATIAVTPVRKSIRVRTTPERAFEVFTAGLGVWWPRDHGIAGKPMKSAVMETHLGGRWFELSQDGTETNIGKIIVWDPPRRFVMTWDLNSQWKPDTTVSSEVEVQFIPDGNGTLVELEHRKFERLGAEGGEKMRKDVDGGWPKLLELFKTNAESA